MSKKFFTGLFIVILISVVVLVSVSAAVRQKKDEVYKELELFAEALTTVQNEYVDATKPKDLIYGALKGMLASLDSHSQFMDPDTYNELKVDTEGQFGGLGIEITLKDNLLTVITPIEDTPAWKAGLKPQDKIVKIDGVITRDISLTDAVKKMRGRPGTDVSLTVLREGEEKLLDFKITRDIIKIKDIKDARILENGIAYLKVLEFRENTAKDFDAALNRLAKDGMQALILDLRNNPGGILDVAVKTAEEFIPLGKIIVYTKGRIESQNLEFKSRNNKPYLEMPMVVLVNQGSASGSEIVAGALQDYKRAIILGVRTFGKASVQTIIPLADGSALRLTTSKYFTPAGRSIHGQGIIPDITIEEAKLQLAQDKDKDVFLELEQKGAKEPESPKLPENYRSDYQLMRALDLLKGINIYKKNK